jgi:hypothetical protein
VDKEKRKKEILDAFEREGGKPMTDRQLMRYLGYSDPNAVRPRVTEYQEASEENYADRWEVVLMKRDLIVFGLILLAFYLGAVMADTRHEAHEQAAVEAALANYEPPALDCKDNQIIEAVKKLADNGLHAQGYTLILEMDNREKALDLEVGE